MQEQPAAVLVQEVRWDTTFPLKESSRIGRKDVGAQVDHLARYLQWAHDAVSGSDNSSQPYQIIYQPAMLLQTMYVACDRSLVCEGDCVCVCREPQSMGTRNEEGVALLIHRDWSLRSMEPESPLPPYDWTLLPRTFNDSLYDRDAASLWK